jgi:NAD(P)H-hydrate epimerase
MFAGTRRAVSNKAMAEVRMIRLTRAQSREIDRISSEKYHIPGIVLMENAARAVADAAWAMLDGKDKSVLILCGGGNNGGDGLAAARHLHNRKARVAIALTSDPSRYQGDALLNWKIVAAMGLQVSAADPNTIGASKESLLIDAIFGTGLSQPPRPGFDTLVAAIERAQLPVLAVDIPSGLDCDTGQPAGGPLAPCVRANRTVTFVAEKIGFAQPSAREYLGEVTVADIGCPREMIERNPNSETGIPGLNPNSETRIPESNPNAQMTE